MPLELIYCLRREESSHVLLDINDTPRDDPPSFCLFLMSDPPCDKWWRNLAFHESVVKITRLFLR